MMREIYYITTLSLATLCGAAFLDAQESALNGPESNIQATAGETIIFTPPPGWRNSDHSALPKHVQVMVVGKGASDFPPSISLGSEEYKGSLKQYLKRIKELNTSKGYVWKDLGNVKTEAGNASLSQVDKKTEWGDVKMMHVILTKNGTVYILTAASLKDEFPKFYRDFFNSLRSLRFSQSNNQL